MNRETLQPGTTPGRATARPTSEEGAERSFLAHGRKVGFRIWAKFALNVRDVGATATSSVVDANVRFQAAAERTSMVEMRREADVWQWNRERRSWVMGRSSVTIPLPTLASPNLLLSQKFS